MILLTGGTGFVGEALLKALSDRSIKCLGRNKPLSIINSLFHLSDINASVDFTKALKNVNFIIHCAARVHVMDDESHNPLNSYREVNTAGTLNLARQAVEAGVKRFIFVSSIKVNGESTKLNASFKSTDIRQPEDFYGQSKSEAEEQLLELAEETGLEVVIIRPTLVYGPGVKANFASLMNLVSKGLPLPFGSITDNKRSLVSVHNLVDLIITCIDHPKAANQVFLVSDDHDVSTSKMVREMAKSLNKPQWQLPIPKWCFRLAGSVFGKQDVVDRLLGSLQVDITHTKETLGWKPPQTLQEGFKETAEAFLLNKENKK
ncbi:SDR family oxidoreductase [Aliivibrio sp. S3MY1]|uniref:UDP-glucose 4-epimerase family protein n=1 Tax=unclassified Aliivibrio TaxID=2645654 RepID=UPI00237921CA|nr:MULTISPECIES: SDR family oxidoreductase [unclassified Aliivibrio]MDD9196718.1 SDR family oxidoreductase [Aliivibrio sp. S3MY1]MDD9199791.1 SDR family oxidoreductase [Aliivibrio sp. S2MY1]